MHRMGQDCGGHLSVVGIQQTLTQFLVRVAGNQIDKPLLDLLQQNIEQAKAAGHSDAVSFMERIRDAARKYLLSSV